MHDVRPPAYLPADLLPHLPAWAALACLAPAAEPIDRWPTAVVGWLLMRDHVERIDRGSDVPALVSMTHAGARVVLGWRPRVGHELRLLGRTLRHGYDRGVLEVVPALEITPSGARVTDGLSVRYELWRRQPMRSLEGSDPSAPSWRDVVAKLAARHSLPNPHAV